MPLAVEPEALSQRRRRMTRSPWRMLLAFLLLVLGGLLGAYIGGRASEVCVIAPSLPPGPASCDTGGLSPLGAVVGCAGVVLALFLWRRWRRG